MESEMTEVKKRGRPRKRVLTPRVEGETVVKEKVKDAVAEQVPEAEKVSPKKFAKRAPLSGNVKKVIISISEDARMHIECGGLSLYETAYILHSCHQYLVSELSKENNKNDVEEVRAPDAAGGSNP